MSTAVPAKKPSSLVLDAFGMLPPDGFTDGVQAAAGGVRSAQIFCTLTVELLPPMSVLTEIASVPMLDGATATL